MYVNGMGFRGIERVTGVSRITIMDWVKQVGKLPPDSHNSETIPEVGELDELETFIAKKRTKSRYGQLLTTFEMEFLDG